MGHKGAESRELLTPSFLQNKGYTMAKYNNQKAKILFLQQMLYESGESHTISMQEILDRLKEHDIPAERKSIYDDMEVLRYFGMDIRYRRERPSGYYLAGKNEEDAVRPLLEIPDKKPEEDLSSDSDDLSSDSEDLSSDSEEETMKSGSFSQGEKESDSNGGRWPQIQEEFDYTKQMKLICTPDGRKGAICFFGEDIQSRWRDDGTYQVTVPLIENQLFYGWLTAMGSDARLLKPKKTVQAYRDYLKALAKEYKIER